VRKVKITIIGKVHDVGYRPFLLNLAECLFIERFDARNVTIDGKQSVVVLVEGDENTIDQFIDLVKREKPENAVVEEIRVEDYDGFVRPIDSYRQSLMVNQLNKIIHIGLKMLEKQDLMLKKQDETIKVIREESEKTRQVVREESEKTRQVVREESEKTRIELGKIIREEEEKTRIELGRVIREESEKTREEIRMLRSDLKSYLDGRLERIESEIEKIKTKLGMT